VLVLIVTSFRAAAMHSALVLSVYGIGVATAYTIPPGTNLLSRSRVRAAATPMSLSMQQTGLSEGGEAFVAAESQKPASGQEMEEGQNVKMVSSSPRWPGDTGVVNREGVFLRPQKQVPKVEKEWIGKRYVAKSRTLTRENLSGQAKWPANVFQKWSGGPAVSVGAFDMSEAKQSATVIAMVLLISELILSAGYYQVWLVFQIVHVV